ncbi:MAG: leucine-rich repeat protein [Treponema sp.]|nr:leucine-rich repeat protein [Treponema sp.]
MKRNICIHVILISLLFIISCKAEVSSPVFYTVSFDSDGGSFVKAQTVEKGKTAKEPACPTKDNCDFLGWFYNGTKFNFSTPINEDITVTAKWNQKIRYYTITYVSAYGDVPAKKTVQENNILDETDLPNLADENHVFKGWYIGEQKIESGNNKITCDITLTAKWGDNVTVSYYSLFGSAPLQLDVKYQSNINQSLLSPVEYNQFVFLGWYYEVDERGNGTGIQAKIADKLTHDLTLYAKWKKATIVFNTNESSSEITNTSIEKYVGQSFEENEIPLQTKKGYTFDGWYDNTNKLTVDYIVNDDVCFISRWSIITYTIQYYTNGGTNPDNSITNYTVEDRVVLPIPSTDDDKIFVGWYESQYFATQQIAEWNSGEKSKNLILYAKWRGLFENITADNIVETINNLKKSATIKATGTFTTDLLNQIRLALLTLATEKPDIEVGLDFSEVSGLTSLPNSVFASCINLVDIQLPNTLTSIGQQAFQNCIKIKKIVIPNSVKSMGLGVFSGCSCLEELTIPFVGSTPNPSTASGNTILGYIFGGTNYNGAYEITYSYYNSYSMTTTNMYYYLPLTLRKVVVSGGKVLKNSFAGCSSLSIIRIPETVSMIDEKVFCNCSNLTDIIIPEVVTSIGNYAFSGCSSLIQIAIPDSVTSIGIYAFSYCSSLKNLNIPNCINTINSYVFSNCNSLQSVKIPLGVTQIGSYAFSGCSSLTDITIPITVTSIDIGAFADCSSLINVEIPVGVTSIQSKSFLNCSSLINITIPVGVISIGNQAFSGCSKITSISVPDSVISMGEGAFSGCSSLEEITLPFVGSSPNPIIASESSLFGYIFGKNNYTNAYEVSQKYSYSDTVTYYLPSVLSKCTIRGGNLLYGVFYGCSSLEIIIIPPNITKIDNSLFYGCSSLTEMTIPNSVKSIGNYAFNKCSSLTDIIIPENITTIGYYVFFGCSSLKTVTIPISVLEIESYAFSSCSSLTEITIPDSVRSIGNNAFYNCSGLTAVNISENLETIGKEAFAKCSSLLRATISNSVTSIGSSAFSDCSNLAEITISEKLTAIEDNTFTNCSSLARITIPDSVKSIGNKAFYNCSRLTVVNISENLETIGKEAFAKCSSLVNIKIPDTVNLIETDVFSGCSSLESMDVPFVGKSLGYATFFGYFFGKNPYDGSYYINQRGSTGSSATTYETCIPSSLKKVNVRGGKLTSGVFWWCSEITEISIQNEVSDIGACAFYRCENLCKIILPNSIEFLSSSMFCYCSSLTTIKIPESVTTIRGNVFWYCSSLTSLTIPVGVNKISSSVFDMGCTNLNEVIFEDVNTWYSTTNSNYVNGTIRNVSDKNTAATYLKSTYAGHYWYKE